MHRAKGWVGRGLGHDKLNRLVSVARAERRRARYLALRALGQSPEARVRDGLGPFELQVFSQNGEDGVLHALFSHLGVQRGRFVEFGIQDGREGNAVLLADVMGWSGLFIEADPDAYVALEAKYRHAPGVATERARVRPGQLGELLEAHDLRRPDLLSIDVDGEDYWIWRSSRVRPKVVVVEYNAALGLERLVQPADLGRGWDGSRAFGASLTALEALGRAKGYRLVHCELAGVNAFFVREDLAAECPDLPVEALYRPANYGLEGREHPGELDALPWVRVRAEDGEPEG